MLVLSRKATEKIQIGDNITLTIIQVKGKTVRIGIDAPKEVIVRRGELLAKEPSKVSSTSEPENSPICKLPPISKTRRRLEENTANSRVPTPAMEDPEAAIATLKIHRNEAPSLSNPESYPRLHSLVKKITDQVKEKTDSDSVTT